MAKKGKTTTYEARDEIHIILVTEFKYVVGRMMISSIVFMKGKKVGVWWILSAFLYKSILHDDNSVNK